MRKTDLIVGTVEYINKLSEDRLEEVYHYVRFLFEHYENVSIPAQVSSDLSEYFERIQKVSVWTEEDITNWQNDMKKMSNWSIPSW
ncbi:MAG: hypothetical protein H7A25_21960 [Leptospiraceae bacterium]|nr:hypothetical protein [Leptospiraceae bacterium]